MGRGGGEEAGGVAFASLRGTNTGPPRLAPASIPCTLTPPGSPQPRPHAHSRPRPSRAPMHTHALQARPSRALIHTHALSMSCSSSWTLRLSSSAGGKPLPTFMKSAAILLLRRKPAALRRSPCSTQASTAAEGNTVVGSRLVSRVQSPAPRVTTVQREHTHAPKESREVGGLHALTRTRAKVSHLCASCQPSAYWVAVDDHLPLCLP